MPLELKNGAVIITDAHYPRHKASLLNFFDSLLDTPPPQLILMGDMCEFLTPSIPYSLYYNKEFVQRVQKLSKLTEVIYLEGNHDFLIKKLFCDAKVFTINEQPVFMEANGKKVAIMHGDKFERLRYRIYARLIRNNFLLMLLRLFTCDVGGRYAKKLYEKLLAKHICTKFDGFEAKKRAQIPLYNVKDAHYLLEGHYHKRLSLKFGNLKYEAFSAFACNKSFFEVEFLNSDISFKEMSFRSFHDEQT